MTEIARARARASCIGSSIWLAYLLVAGVLGASPTAALAEAGPAPLSAAAPHAATASAAEREAPAAEPFSGPPEDENAAQYCTSIADAASDARFARQSEALRVLQGDIDERLARMEAKRAELEAVLKRREDFLKKADEAVVAIYSKMRPDAAAAQMSIMGAESAAAILEKLNPRLASSILNEMEAAKAAQLTGVMTGSAEDLKGEGES